MSEAGTEDLELGPIDYLVVEYPGAQMTGEALPHLLDLVQSGTIQILDVALIHKADTGGTFETIRPDDLVAAGAPVFELLSRCRDRTARRRGPAPGRRGPRGR